MDALKDKFSSSRSPRSSIDGSSTDLEADKYRLLVTAGPSYDTSSHKIVHVNTAQPTVVENQFMTASIKVRIRSYRGLPTSSPSSSAYFDDPLHTKDQYSVAFSFVPKVDLPSVDTAWGNDFDHPVRDRLPPGFNTAFKIVKDFIDPGLECDAYADEPWLYGPSLSCWFGFGVGEKVGYGGVKALLGKSKEERDDALHEGADGQEGSKIRHELGIPETSEKRRKHFLSAANREKLVFEKGRMYHGDFYNPYLDFGNFALKLPGFSIRVVKYIDGKSHTLRYVFKNRKTGDVYFCVNLNLLWGEQLQAALHDEQGQMEKHAGAEAEADGVEVNGHVDESANGETAEPVKEQAAPATRETTEPPPQSQTKNVVDNSANTGVQQPAVDPGLTGNSFRQSTRDVVGDGYTNVGQRQPRMERELADKPAQPPMEPGLADKPAQPPMEPGMTDKPDHLVEEIGKTSIQDMLQDTASKQRTSGRSGALD